MYQSPTKQQKQQSESSSGDGKDYFFGCSSSSSSSSSTLAKTAQRQTSRGFSVTSILTQIKNIDSNPPPPPPPPPHGKIRFDTTVDILDDVIDILPPCSDEKIILDEQHNDDDSSTSISNYSNDEEFCVPILSEASSENRISFYKTSQEQKREFLLDNTESLQKMLAKSRDGIREDVKTPSLISTSHYDDEDDADSDDDGEEEEDDSWLLSY